MDWLVVNYPWFKAIHVIFVIAWMAGLLYLPRLFVYHCGVAAGSEASETFKVMERRLFHIIMNPAMVIAWTFGLLTLAANWEGLWNAGWFHIKLLLAVILTYLHIRMASWRQDFAQDRNQRPARFYRIANEVPTILMIGIVILAIVGSYQGWLRTG